MKQVTFLNCSQKITFCLLFFSFSWSNYSQDILTKRNGETIEGKIELINNSEIKYKKFLNPDGPSYIVNKVELSQIKFQNGTVEQFEDAIVDKKISKEETKEFIVKTINAHGFEEDTFDRKYKASFEGDYLRLIVLRKSGKECNDGILYDFSNVYKFQRVSKRSDQKAFINIFVSIAKNKNKTKWDEHKLIMRVDNAIIAESILNGLKHYNSFFVNQEKTNSTF
jgi:hypothetical protein